MIISNGIIFNSDDETSELGSHESKTEPEAETETETDNEKKHNQTADELSTPCQPESHTISDNVVLEVSTSPQGNMQLLIALSVGFL